MPYGPDAIAFAASSSRQDLEPPPPDFEASSSQLSLAIRPGLSGRLDSSGSAVVGDTQVGRPSISELPASEGGRAPDRGAGTQSSEAQQPEITPPNGSTPNGSSSKTSPFISKFPDPMNANSDTSTSTRSQTVLPPANEFGKLYTSSSLAPQDAAAAASRSRSESRASNFSFQSYATAPESESGYMNDSRPSTPTPRLGGRTG